MNEDIMRTTMINIQKSFNAVHDIEQNMPDTYSRFNDFIEQGYLPAQAQKMAWDKCELAEMRKRK